MEGQWFVLLSFNLLHVSYLPSFIHLLPVFKICLENAGTSGRAVLKSYFLPF